jgi:hypothetical protein
MEGTFSGKMLLRKAKPTRGMKLSALKFIAELDNWAIILVMRV